jgi:hypothetical protein
MICRFGQIGRAGPAAWTHAGQNSKMISNFAFVDLLDGRGYSQKSLVGIIDKFFRTSSLTL